MGRQIKCAVGLTYCRGSWPWTVRALQLPPPPGKTQIVLWLKLALERKLHKYWVLYTCTKRLKLALERKLRKYWVLYILHKTSFTAFFSSPNSVTLNLVCTEWKDWDFVQYLKVASSCLFDQTGYVKSCMVGLMILGE